MQKFCDDLMVSSGPIQVRCYEQADRFGHVVLVSSDADASSAVVMLRSVEGDSDQELPPSGPMQEMVAEPSSVGKPPNLLGLGAAGRSHWSCAIEADLTIDAIAFDFACKTRSDGFMGSTYELLDGFEFRSLDERSGQIFASDTPSICLRCFGDCRLEFDPTKRQIVIISPIPDDQLPPNLKNQRRWRYVVGLAESLVFAGDHD